MGWDRHVGQCGSVVVPICTSDGIPMYHMHGTDGMGLCVAQWYRVPMVHPGVPHVYVIDHGSDGSACCTLWCIPKDSIVSHNTT